jgi:fucose permease
MEDNSKRLQKRDKLLIGLGFIGFIFYAMYTNGFGANAPVMMCYYQIDAARQGFVLTMRSIGSLAVLIYVALRGERHNKIYAYFFGMLMFGIGSALIGSAPSYLALIFFIMICGFGLSLADSMINGMIPELYPKHKTTLLPLLQAFFGIGAMVAPIFVTTVVNPNIPSTFTRPFLIIGAALVCFSVVFIAVTKRHVPQTPYADMTAIRKRVSDNPAEIFKSVKAWFFLLSAFLYFSFPIGVATWLPTYCQEIGIDFEMAGTVLTLFFAGSLVMRFCGPFILKFMAYRTAYIIFTLAAALLGVFALLANNVAVMTVFFALSGFMQGSCVAFLLLMSTSAFPQRTASAGSLPFIAASLATMTVPLWMGAIGERIGFAVPIFMICGLLALSVVPVVLIRN